MKLHLNPTLFRQAVLSTAQKLKIKAEYIEKDYWVTFALHTIFTGQMANDTVFKGGTALSKCYDIIKRFSEDIDLVVVRHDSETDNQLKNKIRNITKAVSKVMPETEVEGITIKRGMNRKTGHTYPKLFNDNYGQVRDVVIVEATWLGYYEPYSITSINSYIYKMMLSTGQEAMAVEYELEPFEIQVLDSRRTICEKIMSLVRFSYSDDAIGDLKKKVRHTYDLHLLLQQKELQEFFVSKDFDNMLLKVAQDDVVSFRNNNTWLQYHPNESLFFAELEYVWGEVSKVYQQDFKALVFEEFPEPQLVFNSLKEIRERMQQVAWEINF